MKPHRRKDTPPRRESAGRAPADAAGTSSYSAGTAAATPAAAASQGAGIYDDPPAAPTQQARPPRKRPARKKVAKKKVPRRGGSPGGAGAPPGRRPPPPRPAPTYGGGVSVMTIFLALVAIGMAAIIAMVVLPKKDMDDIQGYPVNPLTEEGAPPNLLQQTQQVMLEKNGEASFSEEEVNRYLNHRLQGSQGGLMGALVQFKGIYADFEPETVEFVIEREMFGLPLTMSSKLRPVEFRGQVRFEPAGWTLGRFELGSRIIQPVMEMFQRLRDTCADEYQAIRRLGELRFEDDRVVVVSAI